MVAYPIPPVTPPLALELQQATPVAGAALVAFIGASIISWTAPNDGLLHRVLLMSGKLVTSAETGGAVFLLVQSPGDSSAASYTVFPGGQAVGDYAGTVLFLPVKAGTSVLFKQVSDLTVGASTVWAELWAA